MAVNLETRVLDHLLDELNPVIAAEYPHLLALFTVFANEARFGRRWLSQDLSRLSAGGRVLEVGGGLMLLATSLCREGFVVTVLEPIGTGFSAFLELQQVVLAHARASGAAPEVLAVRAEDYIAPQDEQGGFAFAYSINVMEHVDDVQAVLDNVAAALQVDGCYRFTCPNYLFPYEPHFSMPTLFDKTLTWRLLKSRILSPRAVAGEAIPDPIGLWNSLNWITVPALRRHARGQSIYVLSFDKGLFVSLFDRLLSDPEFAARHPAVLRWLARFMASRVGRFLLSLFPVGLLPIIDCTVRRR